jgi:hypothetical protein
MTVSTQQIHVDPRGRVINTPASYSVVPGSNFGPKTGYLDWDFLWFSSITPGECRDSTLKLVYDRYLLNPFQFVIIHLSPYRRRYVV